MTTVRETSATWMPLWLVTDVSITTSVIAPPFFSDTPVDARPERQGVADHDRRAIVESLLAMQARGRDRC